jgi:hypothetical protein
VKVTALIALASLSLAPLTSTLADTLAVTFTGTVDYNSLSTTANSGYSDGSAITGGFLFDTVSGEVSSLTLGTYSAPNGSEAGSAALSAGTDLFVKQGAYVTAGDARNTSITVDFSALGTGFTSTTIEDLLLNGASQIDFTGAASQGFPSTVNYYDGAADGTGITQVGAYLTSVAATVVPLPGSGWLAGSAALGLVAVARRRRAA